MHPQTKYGLLFSASLVAIAGAAGSAIAQTSRTNAGATPAVEEVLVTGSRTITNGNSNPTPVTVLSAEQLLQANPGGIAAALASMPAFIGTAGAEGSAPNYVPVLNLRGLGGGRNLVLLDGQRVQPTSGNGGLLGGVNAALIPSMLLKRVDIVTGGASAVYGSDAVSGVINYIMDRNFDGVKFNLQGSTSTYNDDRAYEFGIAAGTRLFGGRGHVEASYQRTDDDGIPDLNSRKFSRRLYSLPGVGDPSATEGTAANPYGLVSGSRFGNTNFNGVIGTGVLSGLQFTPGGTLAPFIHGTLTGTADLETGGDGGYFNSYNLIGSQKQDVGFGRFDFDLTDNIKFYTEVVAASGLTVNQQQNFAINGLTVGYRNPYLSTVQAPYQQQIAAAAAANPTNSFKFSRIFTGDGVHAPVFENHGEQTLILAGLDGKLEKYNWHVGVESDDSGTTVTDRYNISNQRLYAAMNAVTDPSGKIVCAAAITNPSAYGNCVPINVFGQVSPASYDYIRQYTRYKLHFTMKDVNASFSGSPLSTWAGPIDMAVSAEFRRQTYDVSTNAQSTDPVDCGGIQFNCRSTTKPYYTTVSAFFPKKALTVREVAYEAEVPLLKDRWLAKSLAFNGAVRYTDYSSSGPVSTWKAGLTWAPNDDLNLRVARSHDIRAPSAQQLYAPPACTPTTFKDLVSGITGRSEFCLQGNPDLKPEVADTWTAGVVWKPEFVTGFSTSLDFYHIDIAGAQNIIAPTSVAANLACFNSGGTSPICALYVRSSPTAFPTRAYNVTLNSGGIVTEGLDWEVDYATQLAGRRLSTRLLLNYQPKLTANTISGRFLAAGSVDPQITGMPPLAKLKSVLQLNYDVTESLAVGLQARYRGALKQNAASNFVYAIGKVPAVTYTDLNVSYKLKPAGGDMTLFVNIRNVFNQQPYPAATTDSTGLIGVDAGFVQGDDIIGRYYTLGVRHTF